MNRGQNDKNLYPVCFSSSDTSGEKMYEEFYTDDESVDMDRFDSLGVITGKNKPDIVDAISSYLPEFKYIETGRSLDSKM